MYFAVLLTLFGSGEIRSFYDERFQNLEQCERYLLDITRKEPDVWEVKIYDLYPVLEAKKNSVGIKNQYRCEYVPSE